MREILFRGKRLDNGEWVEGLLFKYKGKFCIALYSLEGDDYGLYPRCYAEVDPSTIGQYTGLCDRNGVRIFEGDIVRHGNRTGHINYGEGCFCVKQTVPLHNLNNPAIDIVFNEYPNDIEVIGNVHDNRELLEVEG